MKSVIMAALCGAVGILAVLSYFQNKSIQSQHYALERLATQLATASKASGSLINQERCAKQSQQEFKSAGYDQGTAGFVNHYNDNLGKCFLEIDSIIKSPNSPGQFINSKTVTDAFEGTTYGNYAQESEKDKKSGEIRPFICDIFLPGGEEHKCTSEDEFQNFVRYYMGQDYH